jgi:outer membrane protein assembly factor BamB
MANKGIEEEFVTALDVKDGKQVWSTRIGKVGNPDQKPNYPGARSTPTVDGATLYVLSSDGDLASLNVATGRSCGVKMFERNLEESRERGPIRVADS